MLLDDVATYLANQGLGLTVSVNLFKGLAPEVFPASTPVVSLIEYPGRAAARAMGASLSDPIAGEFPRFQANVLVPLDNYQSGRTLAENIYKKLDNLANTTLGTTNYFLISAVQPPFYMPPDDANATHRFVANYEARKARG
jgi:minor capsid protein